MAGERQFRDEPGGGPLADTVTRLQEELDGLRRAMRTRALIEQAKGVLMERHGWSADQAFERLAGLSQRANIKLVDVAATLLEATAPTGRSTKNPAASTGADSVPGAKSPAAAGPNEPPQTPTPPRADRRPSPGDLARMVRSREAWSREAPEPSAQRAQDRSTLRRALVELESARTPQELLEVVVDPGLREHPPMSATLAVADPDGVVRLVASMGIPPAVAARWNRLPLDLNLPRCEVIRTGREVWLTPADDLGRWALPDRPSSDLGTAGILPLAVGGHVLGALGLSWPGWHELDTDHLAGLRRLCESAAARLGRLGAAAAEDSVARSLLASTFHPAMVCSPIFDGESRLVDFTIEHANAAAVAGRTPHQMAGSATLAGRRLLEVFPEVGTDSGVLPDLTRVVDEGAVVTTGPTPGQAPQPAPPLHPDTAQITVSRFGAGILVTWRAASDRESAPVAEGDA